LTQDDEIKIVAHAVNKFGSSPPISAIATEIPLAKMQPLQMLYQSKDSITLSWADGISQS
jgi:hypothetical protein